jgi:hypothetical protein
MKGKKSKKISIGMKERKKDTRDWFIHSFGKTLEKEKANNWRRLSFDRAEVIIHVWSISFWLASDCFAVKVTVSYF